MKMPKIGSKYTWKNPYTNRVRTGIVRDVNEKNEMIVVKIGPEIFHFGS